MSEDRCAFCSAPHACPKCKTPVPANLDYDGFCTGCYHRRFRRVVRLKADDPCHVSPVRFNYCPAWESVPPSEARALHKAAVEARETKAERKRDAVVSDKLFAKAYPLIGARTPDDTAAVGQNLTPAVIALVKLGFPAHWWLSPEQARRWRTAYYPLHATRESVERWVSLIRNVARTADDKQSCDECYADLDGDLALIRESRPDLCLDAGEAKPTVTPLAGKLNPTKRKILSLCRRKALPASSIAHKIELSQEHTRRVLAELMRDGRLKNGSAGYRTVRAT
jgi:hypothetical protein